MQPVYLHYSKVQIVEIKYKFPLTAMLTADCTSCALHTLWHITQKPCFVQVLSISLKSHNFPTCVNKKSWNVIENDKNWIPLHVSDFIGTASSRFSLPRRPKQSLHTLILLAK